MAEMVTPTAVERPSWPLTDRADMFDALDELSAQGWRGGINCGPDGQWRIELNHNSGQQVIASIGTRLVLEPFGGLVSLSMEDSPTYYTVVGA